MELWDILNEDGSKTGRFVERGKQMALGEYHLVVDVWIKNSNGDFLISKRTPTKYPWPDMWEPTFGSAVMGDDSLSAALREVNEELGIILIPKNGKLFKRFIRVNRPDIVDVWVFQQDVDINHIVFQADETDDAMWASRSKILQMVESEVFIGRERLPYLDELLTITE